MSTCAERRHHLDEVERGANGALGVVLVGGGRAPQRHDRIADELLDDAAVPVDDLARRSKYRLWSSRIVLGVAARAS